MPINPSIAMSFQAPKFEDPMNNMLKMEQMKAYQQNALAKQIEMQAAQETLGEQRGLRNYLAGLGAGTSPDVNQLARFGEAGQQYSQKMAAAEKDRFEIASKLYKEVYLPQLGQATTRNDVLSWHASMKNNPWVAPVLTPEGEAMLPKTDEEVPGYLERVFVPYQERNKPVPVSKGGALYIPGKGFQTPPAGPQAPQKPFAVGGSVFFPDTNEFKTPPTTPEVEKPKITNLMAEYELAKEEGFEGTFTDFKQQFGGKGVGAGGKTSTQIAKEESAANAIDNLNLIFDKVGPAYEKLAEQNAISDPNKGVWYNVIAAAKSSEKGKEIGQIIGSEAAQARNEIDVLTTAFISQLSKATGLTASQLNSNLEFQTFRRMLESKDIVTARESIDLLRDMFAKRIPSSPKEVTQTFGSVNRQMEKNKKLPAEQKTSQDPNAVDENNDLLK